MMSRVFTEHLRQTGESYFEHQRFAAGFGLSLMAAGCAALVHGLVPCLFETTAGDMVERLTQTLRRRRMHADACGE